MKTFITGDLSSATIRSDNFAASVDADGAIVEEGIKTKVYTYEDLCALELPYVNREMEAVIEMSKGLRMEREWGV